MATPWPYAEFGGGEFTNVVTLDGTIGVPFVCGCGAATLEQRDGEQVVRCGSCSAAYREVVTMMRGTNALWVIAPDPTAA